MLNRKGFEKITIEQIQQKITDKGFSSLTRKEIMWMVSQIIDLQLDQKLVFEEKKRREYKNTKWVSITT